jgi:hypothetical protein
MKLRSNIFRNLFKRNKIAPHSNQVAYWSTEKNITFPNQEAEAHFQMLDLAWK